MNYIDLHVHSNASDGTLTPSELISLAVLNDLSAIALTDHDTISGIPEAQKAADAKNKEGKIIDLIPGVELSCAYKIKDIHILGLFIDIENKFLLDTLKEAKDERDSRNEHIAQKLREKGIDITIDALLSGNKNAVLTRAHFAKHLYEKGYVKNIKEAFQRYIGDTSPCFVQRKYLSPEAAIGIIHRAGGIAVLAHPLLYHLPAPELNMLLHHLKLYGLDAIEAIYSSNTEANENYSRYLARKHNLLISGGTDYHGLNKPELSLGSGKGNMHIPESLLIQMKASISERLKS